MGETVLKQLTNETNRMLDQVIRDLRRLPYDAEIEYLESTGIQYVDSETSLVSGAFDVGVDFDENFNGNNGAIGVQGTASTGTSQDRRMCVYHVANSTNIIIDRGIAGTRIIKSGYSIDAGKIQFAIELNVNRSIYICWANSIGLDKLRGKIRYCKIWNENDELVRDFIPVRLGTTGYLYDKVSGQLFGNAGTGEFVLGPDKKTTRDYVQDGLVAMWDGIENTRERERA